MRKDDKAHGRAGSGSLVKRRVGVRRFPQRADLLGVPASSLLRVQSTLVVELQ